MANNKLTFGKYKNKTIDWIYNNDKAYLDWLVKQDFFKKFNYFKTFRDYKPDPIHIKYCFENNIRFCSWCCKKQRITKDDNKFGNIKDKDRCKECFRGDRAISRSNMYETDYERFKKKNNDNKIEIEKKQIKIYEAHLRKLTREQTTN